MTVDAVEHQWLVCPATLIEHLPQLTAFLPIRRTRAGNADDITGASPAFFDFGQYPLLQLRYWLDFIFQVGAEAGEATGDRMAVSIDHAGHQHLARQIDTLGVGIGQGIDLGITTHLQNLAILDRHRLHQGLAGLGGIYLAVDQHQVGSSQRLQGGKGQCGGQQRGNKSLHRNALLFLSGLVTPYRAQQKNGPLQMRRVRRFFHSRTALSARRTPTPPCS
ncbi:hypothetical protein D3C79_628760 [compost metagenome]